jgi:hypothetical protein
MIALVLAQLPIAGALIDISNDSDAPQDRRYVEFRANDVLLIEARTGQRAVVQFTRVASKAATYRWRYWPRGVGEALTGVGDVAEQYEQVADGPNRVRVLPLPGHDVTVRAGDIRAAWSSRSSQAGFLYYHPRHATVRVLSPESFDKQP